MKNDSLVCVDFDGVICDSVIECFVSSWISYFQEYRNKNKTAVALRDMELFRLYRPFIRSGEDYVVLQYCIENNIRLKAQDDFDAVQRELGEQTLDEFRKIFYSVRDKLLENEKEMWLSLNPVFDFLLPKVNKMVSNDVFHVVSTKEVYYINEILVHNGIRWPENRLHCSGKTPKVPFINKLLEENGREHALFIDDQVDHFKRSDPRISYFLAAWGYIKEEWKENIGAEVLHPSDFLRMIEDFS